LENKKQIHKRNIAAVIIPFWNNDYNLFDNTFFMFA